MSADDPKNSSKRSAAYVQDGWNKMRQNVAETRQQIAQAKANPASSSQSGSTPASGTKPPPATPSKK